jgi:hypothetical protein
MKIKGFLAGFAAVVFASTVAIGANLPLMSGPQDPSQLLASLNSLIRSINTGVSGRLNASLTSTGTTTTVEQTLLTYSLPANQLAADGDAVRVVCWGTTAANTNAKAAKLYFGTSSISSASAGPTPNPNAKKWFLELVVMRSGASAQVVSGNGTVDLTLPTVYTATGTDSLTAAVTIKCTGTTGTAVQDLTAQGMLVEQIK